MKSAAFYVLPAVLLAAMIACSNTDDPIIDEDLLDVVWSLDSLITAEEKIIPHLMDELTIQFTEEMTIRGYVPCEYSYEAVYETYKDGSIEFGNFAGITDSCVSHLQNHIRDTFIYALGAVTLYIVKGNRLDLYDQDRNYVIYLSVGLVDEDLLNVLWIADSLKTPEEKVICRDTIMTIQFSERLNIWGSNSCNGYLGLYQNPGKGTLAISYLSLTANACARRYELLGFYFNTILLNATAYDLKGNSFIVYDGEHRYMLYFSAK